MTHASVFSGIGGPEIAAEMLGWENLFHCEINPFGRQVLDYWFPKSKSYEDITKTDFSEWYGRVNVLTGGFPCQPFSYAGQRRGADDDRYLWPYMHRCINQIKPDWVVCENVAGIASMVEQGEVLQMESTGNLFAEDNILRRYKLRETYTLERICGDIEKDGYEVQPVLILACAVGAPHRRDRVFIIGRCITPDTDGNRRSEVHQHLQPEKSDGEESFSSGGKLFTADTSDAGLQHRNKPGDKESKTGEVQTQRCGAIRNLYVKTNGYRRNSSGARGDECAGHGRWEGFPSVSPVHRGNDGLPFDVDHLTIRFSKWRNESLKAYGNAIVPQVMYEIFRAIEQTENYNKANL